MSRLLKDPEELCCPLSHELMTDPVVAFDGFTYERRWVVEAFKRAPGKSPMTGHPIASSEPWPTKGFEMARNRLFMAFHCSFLMLFELEI